MWNKSSCHKNVGTNEVHSGYQYIKVTPDQLQILEGLWFPWCQDCDRAAIKQLVGIVGAVIMPHNIYLHSALVLVGHLNASLKKEFFDSWNCRLWIYQSQQNNFFLNQPLKIS